MGLSWSLTISLHGLGFATHGLSLTKSVISCFVKWTHAHNPCFSTLLHRRGLTIQNFCCMTWAHSPYFLFLHGWGPYTQYLYKIGLCVRNAQGILWLPLVSVSFAFDFQKWTWVHQGHPFSNWHVASHIKDPNKH